jgi:2-polyprenyl-3-methyl-5-hydroxy-6-metoxy-1,4-benzoquinol methylase
VQGEYKPRGGSITRDGSVVIPMKLLRRIADNRNPDSFAHKLRWKRFAFFRSLLERVDRPLTILDVGGTELFWQQMGFADEEGVEITILNLQRSELDAGQPEKGRTLFHKEVGDARAMPQFGIGQFDVVFSNSVLEHVGNDADQEQMLNEVRRVGKRFFVQTPNYYFPIEPHFLVPGLHYLPKRAQVFLLQHFDLGWTKKVPDRKTAEQVVGSIRLLSEDRLKRFCPEALLHREKFLGLTKSFIIYSGWEC